MINIQTPLRICDSVGLEKKRPSTIGDLDGPGQLDPAVRRAILVGQEPQGDIEWMNLNEGQVQQGETRGKPWRNHSAWTQMYPLVN